MFNLSVVNIIPDVHRDATNQIAEAYGKTQLNGTSQLGAIK